MENDRSVHVDLHKRFKTATFDDPVQNVCNKKKNYSA